MTKTRRAGIYTLVILAGAGAGLLTPRACRLCMRPAQAKAARPAAQAPILAAQVR